MAKYRNRPLNDIVVITLESWTSDVSVDERGAFRHKSGIEIPNNAALTPRQEVSHGYIKAIGPGAFAEDGGAEAVGIKVGDRVLFAKWGGRMVPNEHGMMDMLVPARDIVCVTESLEPTGDAQ